MKRLSELPAEDHVMARTHVLIRAMGQTLDSEEHRRRVRRLLDDPSTGILALRIEALLVPGDHCQAGLAAAYLAQFPNGPYLELAKRALASSRQ